jgi:hypothetical protein
MISRRLRLASLIVALLLGIWDVLSLFVQLAGDRASGTGPDVWLLTSVLVSLVVAIWVGLECQVALMMPGYDKRPTTLPPGRLLGARLVVVSLSGIVPIGYALRDASTSWTDMVWIIVIYGGIAALPLLTGVWALRSGRRNSAGFNQINNEGPSSNQPWAR